MKRKSFLLYKKVSHVSLFIVSLTFTLMLFVQFGNEWYQKILWSLLGFALEVIKLYLWMHLKSQWKTERGSAIAQFVVYAGIAFISMIASLGFSMTTIEGQSFTVQVQNLEMDSLLNEIDTFDAQIETKIQQQAGLPADYITGSDRFTNQINDLRNQKSEVLQRISDIQKENIGRKEEALNVFALIGRVVSLSGRDTLYYLMLIMVVALEVCLVLTSGDIEKRIMIDENPHLISYVNMLFDNASSMTRLATDEAISQSTGIAFSECKQYRNLLANIAYGSGETKKPLIESRRGGTRANFSKDGMIKIIRFHMNIQRNKGE